MWLLKWRIVLKLTIKAEYDSLIHLIYLKFFDNLVEKAHRNWDVARYK